jgi:hypothetical protein
VIRRLQAGDDPRAIQQGMQDGVASFLETRAKYLIYP